MRTSGTTCSRDSYRLNGTVSGTARVCVPVEVSSSENRCAAVLAAVELAQSSGVQGKEQPAWWGNAVLQQALVCICNRRLCVLRRRVAAAVLVDLADTQPWEWKL